MNLIEVTLSDGVVCRWVIESDEDTDLAVDCIKTIVGSPDTMKA